MGRPKKATAEHDAVSVEPDEKAPAEVLMDRDGVVTEVANNESVSIMQALGWSLRSEQI